VSAFALNPSFFDSIVNNSDISRIGYCFPVFIGVFGISVIHEIAHRIAAHYANVKLGLPVPLPSLQIGTFASITPLRSFPRSRSALFDVAMSGPLASAIVSIILMILGISLTVQASSEALDTLAVIPVALMKTSFLVGTICSYMAPKAMMMPLSQLIPIHPLFIVGFSGLISSVLNLLPIGRLDGGRAATAVFGRRSSYLISLATLFFLMVAALTQTSAISIFFGLLVTLFQRNAEIPMRDELTDLDDRRVGIYILSVVLTVLTLAPFPGGPVL
jgi:membrane-associated protease RseP (regulator of RpoE activity)